MSQSLGMTSGLSKFVIDDSNASYFERAVKDPSDLSSIGGFEAGQVETGLFRSFSRSIIPRSDWDDLIREQDEKRTSPDHWRLWGNVPVMNQGTFGYCWMYGPGGAVNTAYAQQGMKGLRLNPFMTAWLIKNGRNVGGWAGEAFQGIDKWGIPEESVWPPDVKNGSLLRNHEVELSAKMHIHAEKEELPRENFDALVSCLLDPERPRPVTLGLQWWGHLIYATKAVKIDSRNYGVKIVNSWKPTWGEDGCAVLAENKAKAFEQVAITSVKPRVAV